MGAANSTPDDEQSKVIKHSGSANVSPKHGNHETYKAGDGTWCYALAAAGALQVVGIESDAALVERFGRLPDVGLRERIDLRCADPVEEIRSEVRAGRQYDVIILFDLLEIVADLHDLFGLVRELDPRLVVVDGRFVDTEEPILWIDRTREAVAGRARPALVPGRGAVGMVGMRHPNRVQWQLPLPQHLEEASLRSPLRVCLCLEALRLSRRQELLPNLT